MSAMINIDDLHKEKKQISDHKNQIYEDILKKCHHKIKNTVKVRDAPNNCFYMVPSYMYGSPIYNVNKCVLYLVKALIANGFDIKYTNPNLLYISWEGKSNPKNFKTLEIREKGYKSIEDYKPAGNFVYDKNTLDVFKKKTINLFN
jgi:hypothetical protein